MLNGPAKFILELLDCYVDAAGLRRTVLSFFFFLPKATEQRFLSSNNMVYKTTLTGCVTVYFAFAYILFCLQPPTGPNNTFRGIFWHEMFWASKYALLPEVRIQHVCFALDLSVSKNIFVVRYFLTLTYVIKASQTWLLLKKEGVLFLFIYFSVFFLMLLFHGSAVGTVCFLRPPLCFSLPTSVQGNRSQRSYAALALYRIRQTVQTVSEKGRGTKSEREISSLGYLLNYLTLYRVSQTPQILFFVVFPLGC